MKEHYRIKKTLSIIMVALLAIALVPFVSLKEAWAGGVWVNTGYVCLYVGEGTTAYITAGNATATYSVWSDNGGIASASGGGWLENETQGIGIYANSPGITYVNISALVADEDTLTESTQSFSIMVEVLDWPQEEAGGDDWDDDWDDWDDEDYDDEREKETEKETEDNRSKDNSLSSISVDGYELVKIDDYTYSLNVKNSADKVNVHAAPTDSKATVSGTGEQSIPVGYSELYVTVTAENGSAATYTLQVNRRVGYGTLADLDESLKNMDDEQITLFMEDGDTLDDAKINKIKESGKTVVVYKYDANLDKYTFVAMNVKLKDGMSWIQKDKNGDYFTADNLPQSVTEEVTTEAAEADSEAETTIADVQPEQGGVNVFLIISIVLAAVIAAMVAVYFLVLKKK